jgi:hypothetical protein
MRPLFAGESTREGRNGCALRGVLLLAAALIALAIAAAPASATSAYRFDGKLDPGIDPVYPSLPCHIWDMDIDVQENVYVICGGSTSLNNFQSGAVVKKFDKEGNPVPFTAHLPYIQGNTLIEDPYPELPERNEYGQSFQNEGNIAVDTSTGPTEGYIYIITSGHLDVLKPSGQFIGSLNAAGAFGLNSVAADAEGNVYYNSGFKIDKRDPSLTVIGQLYNTTGNTGPAPAQNDMALDSTGALWGLGQGDSSFESGTISRWEADQFHEPEQESSFSLGNHKVAKRSPLVEAPLKAFGSNAQLKGQAIAVDRSNDNLIVQATARQILQFSRGTAEEPSHQLGASIGDSSNVGGSNENKGIAIGPSGTIFVTNENEVSVFAPDGTLPTVRDHSVALSDIGHTDATVRAEVELSGGGPITECEVVYGTTRAYGEPAASCSPDPSGSNFTQDTPVTAHLTGLATGTEYHFAIVVRNADGAGYGLDRTFSPAAVLDLSTEPATDITDGTATFRGALNPDGMQTTYHFDYGVAGDLSDSTAESTISGTGEQQVSFPATDLPAGKEVQYRLVASNSLGTTNGSIQSFTVAGPPAVSALRASNVLSEEADLEGRIDAIGYPTTYQFEYGPTTQYGSVIPVGEGDAGEATEGKKVSEHVSGLEPGRVYHFRLVATNEWGTTTSEDTTFNFLPEPCPNEHVRQQMKSSFLPDCRAYELVSPENAEGAQIYPGSEALVQGSKGFPAFKQVGNRREIQNTGLANSPSRFAFYAGLGGIAGLDAPDAMLDMYTSTRTDNGWKTTFSGIQGDEASGTGRKVCSISLDECIDHIINNPFEPDPEYASGESAPRNGGFLFDLDGNKIGTAPTNFETVEEGKKFNGDIRPSPDFTHFAFSSRNAVFAEGGQTESPGSAYDNDLENGSVTLISLLSNGQPIPAGGEGPFQFITIPPTGVSRDGSHILMETRAPEGGHRLYMRVNDATTYEIGLPEGAEPGEGPGVKFIAMSSDGSRVAFRATQRLLPADTDDSADIYLWQENGGAPTLTLLTQANGQGNSDDCNASWTDKCSVELLETEEGDRTGFTDIPGQELEYQDVTFGGIDSKMASSSGGVFFFSPEDLAGPALHNGKNLYLANDGDVHYVATLGASQTIDRIQISPDGEHAGFLTRARLTSYDNEGFEEMYRYTPSTGNLVCVSCLPNGEAPTADVEASHNGPFMSNDGRVFFASADPLVPADSDPYHIPDVYEYVGGRPQLISSGTSSNGKAPGGAGAFVAETLGLESVSSSGQDVFFSTTDTLVPQDHNGNFAKIYDARTNGGFEVAETAAPCVAADECHGAGAATPGPLQIGTGSSTTGGNVPAARPHHKPKKRKCRASKHKHRSRCAHKAKKRGHKTAKRHNRAKNRRHRAMRAHGGQR